MIDYSLVNTLIAFTIVTLIGVGGPLVVLLWDNRSMTPEARLRRAHWRALLTFSDCPEDPDY